MSSHTWGDNDKCSHCGDRDGYADPTCPNAPVKESGMTDVKVGEFVGDPAELQAVKEEVLEASQYQGMRFFINVNEAIAGKSVTVHVVHGTFSRRENKAILRKYLVALGYTCKQDQKKILKGLGFWGKALGLRK